MSPDSSVVDVASNVDGNVDDKPVVLPLEGSGKSKKIIFVKFEKLLGSDQPCNSSCNSIKNSFVYIVVFYGYHVCIANFSGLWEKFGKIGRFSRGSNRSTTFMLYD